MPKGKSALGIVKKYYPNVTKVIDSKKPLIIAVTAQDCKTAKKKAPDDCAMAKACRREFDGAIISTSVAYIVFGETALRFMVPQSVSREIVSFDRHADFRAGEYYLKPPGKSQKLGPRVGAQSKRTAKKYAKRKVRIHKTEGLRTL